MIIRNNEKNVGLLDGLQAGRDCNQQQVNPNCWHDPRLGQGIEIGTAIIKRYDYLTVRTTFR